MIDSIHVIADVEMTKFSNIKQGINKRYSSSRKPVPKRLLKHILALKMIH